MIVNMFIVGNFFDLTGCIKEENINNFVWLIKQFLIMILSVALYLGMLFAFEAMRIMKIGNIELITRDDIGLIIGIIVVVNWIIFQVFYSSYYILIPYFVLCVVNLIAFVIVLCAWLSLTGCKKDTNKYFKYMMLLFTLIHAIVVIRGNGAPKIICSIPNSDYLMPIGCDLSRSRDGTYLYYVTQGDLYLVDKIKGDGSFIKLVVDNKKIVECNLFENGKKVKKLNIECEYVSDSYPTGSYQYTEEYATEKRPFYGFDENGNVIGGAANSIPEGISLFWGIIGVIALVLSVVFGCTK
jgi:hypothetical protein